MKISVEGVAYEFDEATADNVELMDIERATGKTVTEWAESLGRGSMLSITALIWILRRRQEPGLEFADVKFNPSTLKVEQDASGKELAN